MGCFGNVIFWQIRFFKIGTFFFFFYAPEICIYIWPLHHYSSVPHSLVVSLRLSHEKKNHQWSWCVDSEIRRTSKKEKSLIIRARIYDSYIIHALVYLFFSQHPTTDLVGNIPESLRIETIEEFFFILSVFACFENNAYSCVFLLSNAKNACFMMFIYVNLIV